MTHAKLMDATKALEDALKAQEKARLIWLIDDLAHSGFHNPELSEDYNRASQAVWVAQRVYDEAIAEAQAEFLRGDLEVSA